MRGGNFWRWGLGKSEWVRNLLGYDIYTWHLNPTIFTVYRFNNVFSTFHTPPKSAPGAPFYIRTNHEKLLGLIVLNLRNIFLQSCFRVPSRWKVPLSREGRKLSVQQKRHKSQIKNEDIKRWGQLLSGVSLVPFTNPII